MALRHHQKTSVRVASALLVLYLISKRLAAPVSRGLLLYIFGLPIAARLFKYFRWVSILLGGWCNAPPIKDFVEGRSPRSVQVIFDRRIMWATYLGLLWEMRRENSFLGSFWLIRWVSRLGFSNTFLLLYGLLVAYVWSSKGARVWWNQCCVFLEHISTVNGLFLRFKFFWLQNWINRDRNVMRALVVRYLTTMTTFLLTQVIFGVVTKVLWGFISFSYWYFLVNSVGILILKIWETIREHRHRNGQPTNEPTASFAKYKYTPLPTSRHIRLLILHSRHPSGPVECSLIPVLLEHAPRFQAVSYRWGSTQTDFSVLVDGKLVPVTANAHNLLRDMSSLLFPRLIWIDSICIDQNNPTEKGVQVKLMGELYGRASLVTIWLSRSPPKQSIEDEHKDNLSAALAAFHIKQWSSMEPESITGSGLLGAISEPKLQPLWNETLKLLDNPYFERTWIIQEIVLAKRIRVLVRTVEIGWETFFGAVQRLSSGSMGFSLSAETDDESIRSTSPSMKISEIGQIQIWRTKRQKGELISFRDAAFYTRRFQATDLRDKIFGVLGLCGNSKGESTVPDYSADVAVVFLNATRRLIKEEGVTGLFSVAGIGYFSGTTPGLESLPSWAPDWGRAFYCVPFSNLRPYLDYNAGGKVDPNAHHVNGASLFLSAHLLDTIVEVAPPMDRIHTLQGGKFDPKQDFRNEDWYTVLDSLQLIMESSYVQMPYPYTTMPQVPSEVFWRLLIGDRIWTQIPPAPADMAQQFVAYLELTKILLHEALKPVDERYQDCWDQILALLDRCEQYKQYTNFTCAQRRVCVTEKGYVCLVPAFSKIGDSVAVVRGAQAPLVVRCVEGTAQELKYQLVGECYVHGIMYGEALVGIGGPEVIEVV